MEHYALLLSNDEFHLLTGLPHLSQLTYFHLAFRVDHATHKVGEAQHRISYQAMREWLYVEPKQGLAKTGSPSISQLRTCLQQLEHTGLVTNHSISTRVKKQLILKLPYRQQAFQALKKLSMFIADYSHPFVADEKSAKNPENKSDGNDVSQKNNADAHTGNAPNLRIPQVTVPNNTQTHRVRVATPIDSGFAPSAEVQAQALVLGLDAVHLDNELQKFICYHQAHLTQTCDWQGKFLGWLVHGKKRQSAHSSSSRRTYDGPTKQSTPWSEIDKVRAANGRFRSAAAIQLGDDDFCEGH